jgi:acyl carrier protein
MLDIILFVETEFGISVSDRETTPANFETITRIAAYVDRKLQEAAA